jgi:hypothetical protein
MPAARTHSACLATAALLSIPCLGYSQAGELSPRVAENLVVEIISMRQGRKDVSAGTLVGYRSDTLYIVTAAHNIEEAESYAVRLATSNSHLEAHVFAYWPLPWDLAVLVAAAPRETPRILPRVAGRRRTFLYSNERLFLLGCPLGRCWNDPEPAERVPSIFGERLAFRSPFVEPGFSGGPLVDEDGALLGIIIHADGLSGEAIYWPAFAEGLRQAGVAVNLKPLVGLRRQSLYVKFMPTVYPLPARDFDGQRLAIGGRVEVGIARSSLVQFAFSIHRFSADGSTDNVGLVAHSIGFGYRMAGANPFWTVGRPVRDVVTLGFDVLLPMGSARAIGVNLTDSIDVRTGERVSIPGGSASDGSLGVALSAEYRIALSERIAAVGSVVLYAQRFEFRSTHAYPAVQIGVEWRKPEN